MRPKQRAELTCLEAPASKAGAKVYDFGKRQKESRRHPRMCALEHENALLARVSSEIRNEIARLRTLLAAPS
jgi:hypothetical protein